MMFSRSLTGVGQAEISGGLELPVRLGQTAYHFRFSIGNSDN